VLLSVCDIGDSAQGIAVDVSGIALEMPVARSGHTFCPVEMEQVSACNLVEHAPDLGLWIGRDVGRRGSTYGSSLEIEAQPITLNTTDPPLDGAHLPSLAKNAVTHVGAECKVPEFVRCLACEGNPVPSVVQLR